MAIDQDQLIPIGCQCHQLTRILVPSDGAPARVGAHGYGDEGVYTVRVCILRHVRVENLEAGAWSKRNSGTSSMVLATFHSLGPWRPRVLSVSVSLSFLERYGFISCSSARAAQFCSTPHLRGSTSSDSREEAHPHYYPGKDVVLFYHEASTRQIYLHWRPSASPWGPESGRVGPRAWSPDAAWSCRADLRQLNTATHDGLAFPFNAVRVMLDVRVCASVLYLSTRD